MESTHSEDTERKIKHVIAVMSGKGGVGKSVVTALLAIALRRQGLRVGVLDGDLNGPSIVHMFGAGLEISVADNGNIEPIVSPHGIKIMSMSMFAENENEPIVWRGPMVSSAFKQFYSEVEWGQLDYMLVDVPPGTADVPMTVLQSLPLDGVVIVSTPQVIATAVVKKCVNMVFQLKGKVLGVVENLAYFIAPGGEYCEIFGPSNEAELLTMAHTPLLGKLPLDPGLAALCDAGRIEEYAAAEHDTLAANFCRVLEITR